MMLGVSITALVGLCLLSIFLKAFRNVFFHPLGHIPGPKSWIAFPLLRQLASVRGLLDIRMREFHDTYGDTVRFGPDEVSFITVQAWKDIYERRNPEYLRFIVPMAAQFPDVFSANDADHTRFRKALIPAFSNKGLQDQESVVRKYVDQLIEKLKDVAESGMSADMVKWYNLTTFDIIGDLSFGESFHGLHDQNYHFLVALIFETYRMMSYLEAATPHPWLLKLLLAAVPKSVAEAKVKTIEYAELTVQKRMNNQSLHGRGDFMDPMLLHRGEKDGLNDKEIVANASNLITAGSETTATLLSGLTYWLLRTPAALKRVTMEVRSAFDSEEDITFSNAASRLPYMLACIEEAFRMYPPVPTGLQRLTPPTGPVQINGYEIAANTKVSVHHSAAYTSKPNFHCPERYIPERWLTETKNDPSSPFHKDRRDVVQPFSLGPRMCMGRALAYNEMRLIFARVLWNFDLKLCQESERWSDQRSYFLWEKSALMCKLKSRLTKE